MMGSGGGSGTSNPSNSISDAALGAISSMLEIVSNPAAAKEALAGLAVKSAELRAAIKDLDAKRAAIDATHKETIAKHGQTVEKQRLLAAQEADLRAREDEVGKNLNSISSREQALAVSKKNLEAISADLTNRAVALATAEQESASKSLKMLDAAEKEIKERKFALDQEHATRMTNANRMYTEANAKNNKATEALLEAERLKKTAEKRKAALEQIMQEDQ